MEPPFADVVGRLCCLRGVSTLTALALTVEIGDWTRFRPQSLGPFLGLTPSEDSSGQRRRQGAITKTGNSHARRLLVEAAWQQRRPLRASATLERRRQGQPAAVKARADQSARRLHHRWQTLEARGKPRTIVAVASHASSPATAGRSPPCSRQPSPASTRRAHRRKPREERPARRLRAANPHRPRSNSRQRQHSPSRTPGHAVPTRAYQPRPQRRQQPVRSPRRQTPTATTAQNACALDKPPPISASGFSGVVGQRSPSPPGSAYQTLSGSSYSSMKHARSSARRDGTLPASTSATTRPTPGWSSSHCDNASTTSVP